MASENQECYMALHTDTLSSMSTSAAMSSDADLSFITTMTPNKVNLCFYFSSGLPLKNKIPKSFSFFLPVDPLLDLVFSRQLVVIFLGTQQCCRNSDNSLSLTVLQSRCRDKNVCGTPCAHAPKS